MNPFADGINNASTFIVKNNNARKAVKVMGVNIAAGNSYNLMDLPGVIEADIKVSLLKGVLKRKLSIGEISITACDLDLTGFNTIQNAFIQSNNVQSAQSANFYVANLATLALVNDALYNNGTRVFVNTLKDIFILDKGATQGTNGSTILSTLSGVGRWFREIIKNPAWGWQPNWYVDASIGNDENDGYTSLTPVKSLSEVGRRLGRGGQSYAYNVYMLTDQDPNDVPIFDFQLKDGYSSGAISPRTRLLINGARTTLTSGTISATNDWLPSANRSTEITATGITWANYIGKYIYITGGTATNVGAGCHIMKDLGANAIRTTRPYNPLTFVSKTLAINDTFDVVRFTKIYNIVVNGQAQVQFFDCELDKSATNTLMGFNCLMLTVTRCKFYSSNPSGTSLLTGDTTTSYSHTLIELNLNTSTLNFNSFSGGLAINNLGFSTGSGFLNGIIRISDNTSFGNINFQDTISQNARFIIQGIRFAGCMSFGASGTNSFGAFDTPTGQPTLFLAQGARCSIGVSSASSFFGSGNEFLFKLVGGSSLTYFTAGAAQMYAVGSIQDISIDSLTSVIPPLVAGAIVPNASPLTTWAQLQAPPFSGNAINYAGEGSRIIRTES